MKLSARLDPEVVATLHAPLFGYSGNLLATAASQDPRCPECDVALEVTAALEDKLPVIRHPLPLCPLFAQLHEELA